MRPALVAVALAAACRTAPEPAPLAPRPAPSTAPTASSPGPTEPPPAPKDPLHAAVEASVMLYEALGAIDPSACPAAATRAQELVAGRATELTAVRTAARSERRAEVDALYEASAPRLASAMGRIDALLGRCGGEPGLIAAIEALTGERPGGHP